MDINFFLHNLWLWKCGYRELNFVKEDFVLLKKEQWSPYFERLMRNRLILGSIRYGKLNEQYKPNYDKIESIKKKLKIFEKTKNKEILVDIANLCLLEFEEGDGVFIPSDDKDHVRGRIK